MARDGSMTGARIDGLVDELVAWADGKPELEAAVLALTSSAWLENRDFVRECVVHLGEPPVTVIDWLAAREFLTDPGADAEAAATLRLALDLAGTDAD